MFDWIKKVLFEEEEQVVDEAQLEDIDFSQVDTDMDHLIHEQTKPTLETKTMSEPLIEKTASFGIDLEPKPIIKEKKEEYQYHSEVKRDYKPEIVIPTVISPIYGGVKLDNKKANSENADIMPKIKRSDALGTVISPVYGQQELETHRTSAVEKMANAVRVTESWEDDIPLNEFLQAEEENPECKQFSLFEDELTHPIEEEL